MALTLALAVFASTVNYAGEVWYGYDEAGRIVRSIDEQNRVTDFIYDAAGNLLEARTNTPQQGPTVTSLTPNVLRRGESILVQAVGTDLLDVSISSSDPGLVVSNIERLSATATQIRFRLTASLSAGLGLQTLTFSNTAGNTTVGVTVNAFLPKVDFVPAPLAVPPDSAARQFMLRLSNADSVAHTVALSIADPALAAVTSSVTFPPGTTEAPVALTGLSAGQTQINASSQTLGSFTEVVYVTAEYAQMQARYSPVLTVVLTAPASPTSITVTPLVAPHVAVRVTAFPTANAGADQSVDEGAGVTLAGSGSDPDGTIAGFAWTQTAGPSVTLAGANTATAAFTAPMVTADTVLSFRLTVTDNQGATAGAATNVTVRNLNQSPTANAGAGQSVKEGATVTLSGSGTDPDGTIAGFAWTQTAGPAVTLTGADTATGTFTAPPVTVETVLTFRLVVTDNGGATGSASVDVTVRPNVPPTANAGADQSVDEGASVGLSGAGNDPDGSVAAYAWTQTAGPVVTLTTPNAATAGFLAPQVTADTVLTFQLTVTDDQGATGSATTNVTVRNVNQPPSANAGTDQSVNEGATATLSGSGNDADGTIASYAWTQTAGPVVTLATPNAATAGFLAPQVTADTVLTFQLTVTDNQGATGSATTNVTVRNVNQSPTANAGADQSVNEGLTVTLAGSGSDPDGTIASYAWTQTAGPPVTLNNAATATAGFTAPQVTVDTVLGFRLTVTDNQGATGSAMTNVTVRNVNQPPAANAGPDQTVNEGASVTLSGSGSDADGTIATHAWAQTAGPAVTLTTPNAATTTFIAPQVTADTVLTFRLTVTDNQGATGTDTVNVTDRNIAAGPDLVVTAVSTTSTSVMRGRTIRISHTVRNQGNAAATAFSNGLYLSTDPTIATSDVRVGTSSVASLGVGANRAINTTVTIPTTLAPGTYYIGAIADYTNTQTEQNETNNALRATNTIIVN